MASNFTRLREFVDSLPDVSATRRGQGQGERGGSVPGFGVCPVAAGLSRLLICGFHDGLIDCCEQLILFCDELEVFVMIPDDSHVDYVVETFVERMEDGGIPGLEHRVSFTRGAGRGVIDFVEEQHPERRGRIQGITGEDQTVMAVTAYGRRSSNYLLRSDDGGEHFYLVGQMSTTGSAMDFELKGGRLRFRDRISSDFGRTWTRATESYFGGTKLADGSGKRIANFGSYSGKDRLMIAGDREHDWIILDGPYHKGARFTCEEASGCWMLAGGTVYRPLE